MKSDFDSSAIWENCKPSKAVAIPSNKELRPDYGLLTGDLTVKNGTYDCTITNTRYVVECGIVAMKIPKSLIPMIIDLKGQPLEMEPFGHFPDFCNDVD